MRLRKKNNFLQTIFRSDFYGEGFLNFCFFSSILFLGFGTLHQAVVVADDYVHTLKTTTVAQVNNLDNTFSKIDYGATGSISTSTHLDPCALNKN